MTVLTLWVHERIVDFMPKGRPPSPKALSAPLAASSAASSVPETKDSINLRIDARSRTLIDEAAAMLGKTRTDFMVEAARREAIDVLLDQSFFLMDAQRYDTFARALDDPPPAGAKLRSLLRRVPAWEK